MPIADCGHPYTSPEPGIGGAAGYAIRGGAALCYACSHAAEVAELLEVWVYTAYLHASPVGIPLIPAGSAELDHAVLTTWTGGLLARITDLSRRPHNWGGYLYYFRAIDVHGQHWYGTSPGPGMYARMHKCKRQPLRVAERG